MAFTRQANFSKKVTDLPDVPSPAYTATQIKEYIETPSDENKSFVDSFLDELEADTGSASVGAKKADGTSSDVQTSLDEKQTKTALSNVTGATLIGAKKGDGTTSTVQGALDEKAVKGGNWTGTWQGYTPSKADPGISSVVDQHTSQLADLSNNTSSKIHYTNSMVRNGAISNFIKRLISGNGVKIAALGDSITDCGNVTGGVTGGASSPDKGWFPLVTQFLQGTYTGVQATNRGVGGQTVSQAFSRIITQIIPFDYDLIIIELGTNDWNYGTSLAQFETDYRNLIQELVTSTRSDLLCLSLGWFKDYTTSQSIAKEWQYNQIIRNVASEFGIGYVDMRNAMMYSGNAWGDITYTSDPVHPNDLGHQIWSKEVISWVDFQGYLIDNDFRNKSFETFITPTSIRSNKTIAIDNNPSYYKGSSCYVASNDTTGELYLVFYGTSVKIIYTKSPTYGIMHAYIDGGVNGDDFIDGYAAATSYGNIYEFTNLPEGWHFISITIDTKNSSSTGYSTNIEGVLAKNVKKEENLSFTDGTLVNFNNDYYEEPFVSATCFSSGYAVVSALNNKNATIGSNPTGQSGYLKISGY